MKQLAGLLAGALLAGWLGACTVLVPDPPEPVQSTRAAPDRPVELPPDCPQTGVLAEPAELGTGSEAQLAGDLLAAVDEWSNAGSALVANEPDWVDPGLPRHCLEDLAEAIGDIHGAALLAVDGDETLRAFREDAVRGNLANLQTAGTQGQATNARRELVLLQLASTSEDGTFLNLIVRRFDSRANNPSGMEEWRVIMAPRDSRNLVFHLETKDAPHGSFSW